MATMPRPSQAGKSSSSDWVQNNRFGDRCKTFWLLSKNVFTQIIQLRFLRRLQLVLPSTADMRVMDVGSRKVACRARRHVDGQVAGEDRYQRR
jgi:hypothetical protein